MLSIRSKHVVGQEASGGAHQEDHVDHCRVTSNKHEESNLYDIVSREVAGAELWSAVSRAVDGKA